MRKITTEEFDSYLNSFNENNVSMIHSAIRMVTSGAIFLDYTSEISKYRKQLLIRKVLRYVAKTAINGTMEIDGLATSCSFHEMKDGDPVSFGTLTEWSFYSRRLNKTIYVEIDASIKSTKQIARYYDKQHNLLMEVEIWTGCHFYQIPGRIDLIQHFEDNRNKINYNVDSKRL